MGGNWSPGNHLALAPERPAPGQPCLAPFAASAFAADETLALGAFARQLTGAANCFCLFPCTLFRWLLIIVAQLHLSEDAFTLHLLLQRLESLINIVIANNYLHAQVTFISSSWLAVE